MASKAQLKGAEKWAEKNKDKRKVITYQSYTKKFIDELANEKDLDKIIEMVKLRKQSIQKGELLNNLLFILRFCDFKS